MGKKYTQFNEDTAPTDDDILLGVDSSTGLTKRHTRANLLTANPIIDPTIKGSANGDLFLGKYNGWVDSALSFALNASNGQKEYVLRVSNTDVTNQIYVGQKIKVTRGVAAPTQCTDLEATTAQQYWAKTSPSGLSFTDDWSTEAWIKQESNTGADQTIVSKYNGSTSGFIFYIDNAGKINTFGNNAGSASSITSVQSIPTGIWTHVAATTDLSGASFNCYINGCSVPVVRTGANTAINQAGNLNIGNYAAGSFYFDGKISDVRIWNAVRTGAQIRDNMNQQLTGSETNLVGYWKFNGNGNDSTSNANNLTATGTGTTPTATNADNPMNNTEYGIVTKVSFSTHTDITVFTGTDYNIPNMSISDLFYSGDRAPSGFPSGKDKWYVEYYSYAPILEKGGASISTWYNGSMQMSIPIGEWLVSYSGSLIIQSNATGGLWCKATFSTANNTESDIRFSTGLGAIAQSMSQNQGFVTSPIVPLALTAQTIYYMNMLAINGSGTINLWFYGSDMPTTIRAYSAYV